MSNVKKIKRLLRDSRTVLYIDAHSNIKIPNLALMKLSYYLEKDFDYASAKTLKDLPTTKLFRDYDVIFVSCIFSYNYNDISSFISTRNWESKALIGGCGTPHPWRVEDIIGEQEDRYDFSLYPDFEPSIGFSQRGCRNKCKFCVVPAKEGKNHSINSIKSLMRSDNSSKDLILLDNDFFGQKEWKEKIIYIIDNDINISFNQGINLRFLTGEQAKYLVEVKPRSFTFKQRLLNTAWDQLKDEKIFRRKLEMLLNKGFNPKHIMVYMLVGFEKGETFDDIWYRFWTLQSYGVFPYPMPFFTHIDNKAKALRQLRQWVTVFAKDRFVKHNTGSVKEIDYYRDFREYFLANSKHLPKDTRDYFKLKKFDNIKGLKGAPKKRIRADNKPTSLWD